MDFKPEYSLKYFVKTAIWGVILFFAFYWVCYGIVTFANFTAGGH